MNLNGCLVQLSALLLVFFGVFGLVGVAVPVATEFSEPSAFVITAESQQVEPTRIAPTLPPTFTPSPDLPSRTPVTTLTASNTATFTPSATATLTPTPTNTATITASPTFTNTATPTVTFTATFTPTPAPICQLRINRVLEVNLRAESNASSELVVQMPNNTTMDVYAQEIGFDGLIWFFVEVTVEEVEYEGWVRSDLVEQVTPCPEL